MASFSSSVYNDSVADPFEEVAVEGSSTAIDDESEEEEEEALIDDDFCTLFLVGLIGEGAEVQEQQVKWGGDKLLWGFRNWVVEKKAWDVIAGSLCGAV